MRIDTNAVNYYNSMNVIRTSNTSGPSNASSVKNEVSSEKGSDRIKGRSSSPVIPGLGDFSIKMDSSKVYLANSYGDTAEISRHLTDIDKTLDMLGISEDNEFQVNKQVDGSLNVTGGSPAEAMRLEHYLNA